MKQSSFCNARRNLLIGLLATLAPLAALHAADSNEQGRQAQTDASPPSLPSETPDRGTASGQHEQNQTPSTDTRGVQGPIRSDTSSEQPADYSREVQRRPKNDDKMRQQDDERRRLEERGSAMPDNTLPSQPPS